MMVVVLVFYGLDFCYGCRFGKEKEKGGVGTEIGVWIYREEKDYGFRGKKKTRANGWWLNGKQQRRRIVSVGTEACCSIGQVTKAAAAAASLCVVLKR
ncbi:hypothetical protein Tsubulata_000880 [Turnera subulata]|uniref:Secreted protein n=1 Tax=Turnera subulata TaxID=218843 RepID=A0A9Q0JKL8_9ROSI|nr:hypothetical protein Tsubulata_000880 [Turnera subulata]